MSNIWYENACIIIGKCYKFINIGYCLYTKGIQPILTIVIGPPFIHRKPPLCIWPRILLLIEASKAHKYLIIAFLGIGATKSTYNACLRQHSKDPDQQPCMTKYIGTCCQNMQKQPLQLLFQNFCSQRCTTICF